MATVYEIAAGIGARLGSVDRARTNKLVYYVQAWSLVFNQRPAFIERIEAWKNGPVTKALWADMEHNGGRLIEAASKAVLSDEDRQAVDQVLFHYGHMSAGALIALTHAEAPWRLARGDLPEEARSSTEITHASMREYYGRVWRQASADNRSLSEQPAFRGSVDELERFLGA